MPGYFETMRLPMQRGRSITDRDDGRESGVVIINQRAAAEYWPGEDPIGKRITLENDNNSKPIWLAVIGVVANAKQSSDWAATPGPEIYVAALQSHNFLGNSGPLAPHMTYITLVVRSGENPVSLVPAVKQTVWSFDRNLPISDVATMERVVADATAQPRFEMLLLAAFGAVALILAAVGIYGVMNYSVSRRTREIGIRISLGASRTDVVRMVVQQAMLQAFTGAAAGITGAILLSKLMTKMLYGVHPTDPSTFGGVFVVLGLAALLAICVPARRATRIEPIVALRNE
jgi:predicted permease